MEGVNESIQFLKMKIFVLNELSKADGWHFCKIENKGKFENFFCYHDFCWKISSNKFWKKILGLCEIF